MADCIPNTVLLAARSFSGLTPQQRHMAVLRLLSQWLLTLEPGADVTPDGIMARASAYAGKSELQYRMIFLQLLCNIRGT